MQVKPPASQAPTIQPNDREDSATSRAIGADDSPAQARLTARANHPLAGRRVPAAGPSATPPSAAAAEAPVATVPSNTAPTGAASFDTAQSRPRKRAARSNPSEVAQRSRRPPATLPAQPVSTQAQGTVEPATASAPLAEPDQFQMPAEHPGVQLLRQGRMEESLAAFEHQLNHTPNDGPTQVCKAYVQQRLGRWQDALDSFDAAVAAHYDSPAVHVGRALSLQALGDYSQAILAADAMPSNAPAYLLTMKIKAASLCSLGQVQAGAEIVSEAVRNNPDSPLPYLARAEIALHPQIQRPDLALLDIACAVERTAEGSPDYPATLCKLGSMLVSTGNFLEASVVFQNAVTMQPNHYVGQLGLGKTQAALQRPDLALQALDAAVALEPARSEAYHLRGHALISLGRFADATEDFRKLAEFQPQASLPKFSLAGVLVKQGRFDEALDIVDQGLRIDPDHAEAHGIRGLALDGMARAAQARSAELFAARRQQAL